jgi:hypothetical protein
MGKWRSSFANPYDTRRGSFPKNHRRRRKLNRRERENEKNDKTLVFLCSEVEKKEDQRGERE